MLLLVALPLMVADEPEPPKEAQASVRYGIHLDDQRRDGRTPDRGLQTAVCDPGPPESLKSQTIHPNKEDI